MRKYSMVPMIVRTPISPRNAHERWLRNTVHTKAQSEMVLVARRTKTSVLEVAGGGGVSAMSRRIQDGHSGCGNSFRQITRNLFPAGWFHGQTRAIDGIPSLNQNQP
jgi:hypothetical protein